MANKSRSEAERVAPLAAGAAKGLAGRWGLVMAATAAQEAVVNSPGQVRVGWVGG